MKEALNPAVISDLKFFNLWAAIAYCVPDDQFFVFVIAVGSVCVFGVSVALHLAVLLVQKYSP